MVNRKSSIILILVHALLVNYSLIAQALGPMPVALHTIVLHSDGTVYSWGFNDDGQLGDNTDTSRNCPIRVLKGEYNGTTYLGDDPSNKIIAVASGAYHSIAVTQNGIVYTWGYNGYGQLGDGTILNKMTPQRVLKGEYNGTTFLGDDTNNKITAVALGRYHSIALASDGTVYCWGWNNEGQAGDNTSTERYSPVRVLKGEYSGTTFLGDDPNNKIIAVALGRFHSMALAQDGTVYSWGENFSGQLGDSTIDNRFTPVRVLKGEYSGTTFLGDDPNNKIIDIALGMYFSSALAEDGKVYTWGSNPMGQLGDSTIDNRFTPVKVLKGEYSGTTFLGDDPNNKIIDIALGRWKSIALAEDGTAFSWGYNGFGQLGDNTTENRFTPVRVLMGEYNGTEYLGDNTNNKITSVALAAYHCIALAEDGTTYSWGYNGNGELGDNTTTTQIIPVKVGCSDEFSLPIDENSLPSNNEGFTVLPAYPNPFNPSTTITYELDNDSSVVIEIFNVSGKLIKTLLKAEQKQGWHSLEWNGTNQDGEQVPVGMYISKIIFGDEVETVKLMLVK